MKTTIVYFSLIIINTYLLLVVAQDEEKENKECCPIKKIWGNKNPKLNGIFQLVGKGSVSSMCSSSCIYEKKGDMDGQKFCFAFSTDSQSQCQEDTDSQSSCNVDVKQLGVVLGDVIAKYLIQYEKPVCPSPPRPQLNMTSSVLEPIFKLEPYFKLETPYTPADTNSLLPNMFSNSTPANESEYVYDLLNSKPLTDTSAGFSQIVRSAMWTKLAGIGLAIARYNNPPCVVGIPHYHIYSNEIGFVTRGSNISFGIKEAGKPLAMVKDLKAGQLVFFPQGSIHYLINLSCEEEGEALLIHTNERTDTLPIGASAMGLPDEILTAAFNTKAENIEQMKTTKTFEWELLRYSNDCLQRCGLPLV